MYTLPVPSIEYLANLFSTKIATLDLVPVGGTGYMDLVGPNHFIDAQCDEANYGSVFQGVDVHGRKYLSFKLKIVQENDHIPNCNFAISCIYTVFERYSNDSAVICICPSHYARDMEMMFLNNILKLCGLRLTAEHGWPTLVQLVQSFANTQKFQIKSAPSGFSSSHKLSDAQLDHLSTYTVSMN